MGMMRKGGHRMRGWRRSLLLGTLVCSAVLAGGCDTIQDMREELGLAEAPPPPLEEAAPIPVAESHWIPADADVEGIPHSEWAQRWWQWAARFPNARELPYLDPDGRRCDQFQQDGPIWFLAGTDGNFEVLRNCRIPDGKHLFVPVINYIVSRGLPGDPEPTCEEKQAEAARFADHVLTGLVLLDGRPVGELKRMRAASGGCFESFRGEPEGATDGYWLMLKPLPAGKHQLAITAAYRDGAKQMLQNFRYELEVEEASAATADVADSADSVDSADLADASDAADPADAAQLAADAAEPAAGASR